MSRICKGVLIAATLALAACGGGGDAVSASAQAQAARPEPQAQQAATGVTAEQLRAFVALRGRAPTAAEAAAFGTQTGAELATTLASSSTATSDAALAQTVLANLGVSPQTVASASYTTLQDALTQYFAAYGSAARGVIVNNLAGLLANLPLDVTWGAPSRAFNAMVASGLSVLNNTAAAVSGCTTVQMAIGLTITGAWTADDCVDPNLNVRYDQYALQLTSQAAFRAEVSGGAGRQLRIFASDGRAVGEQPSDAFAPAAVDPLTLQYILPAGDYIVRVYSAAATSTGNYTLKLSSAFSTAAAGDTCLPVTFTTYGVATTQSIAQGVSCVFQGGLEDRYLLLMRIGERVTVTLDSAAFAPYLLLRDDRTPTSPVVGSDRKAAAGSVTVSYTATFSGFHEIIVTSNDFTSKGTYTLTVTSP
ncbi:hypothetical protein [Ramlibacter albus]|uniref:Peptidase C-terminal archaeal/bacterial domain-containing protein n=1 Tax=Ramlibacter albus TaxID=2079448 RepID=A0A923M8P5_9BURK|nr:hypothetical protein [Ramlibacter albus]MBC5764567.1 hypothetical protein [Ramlibacter albus]